MYLCIVCLFMYMNICEKGFIYRLFIRVVCEGKAGTKQMSLFIYLFVFMLTLILHMYISV